VGTSDPYFLLGFFLFFLYHTIYPISSPGRAKALGIRDASGPAEIPGLPTFDQVRFSDKWPAHGDIIGVFLLNELFCQLVRTVSLLP